MKKIIFTLCLGLLLVMPAYASSKEEKVAEILELTHMDATLNASIEAAIIPIVCTFIMSEEDEKSLKQDFKEVGQFPSLVHSFSQFWIDNYTEQELDDLLAFYRTNTGKKLADLQPQQAQYNVKVIQEWSQNIGLALNELGRKYAQKYPQRSGDEAQKCILLKSAQ